MGSGFCVAPIAQASLSTRPTPLHVNVNARSFHPCSRPITPHRHLPSLGPLHKPIRNSEIRNSFSALRTPIPLSTYSRAIKTQPRHLSGAAQATPNHGSHPHLATYPSIPTLPATCRHATYPPGCIPSIPQTRSAPAAEGPAEPVQASRASDQHQRKLVRCPFYIIPEGYIKRQRVFYS